MKTKQLTLCLLLFAAAFMLSTCRNFEKNENDLEKCNLKGSVHTVITLSYDAFDKFGEGKIARGELHRHGNEQILFDSIGNITQKLNYYIKDVILYDEKGYDTNGYLIKDFSYSYDDGEIHEYISYTFINDSKGNPLVRTNRKGDKIYYTYSENGLLLKETKDNGDYETFKYDKDGNMIESQSFLKDFYGNFYRGATTKYSYDSNRNQIRQDIGNVRFISEYIYDNQNQPSELFFYEHGDLMYKNRYLRNERGDIIKLVSWDKDGKLKSEEIMFHLYDDTLKTTSLQMNNDNLFYMLYLYSYNPNNTISSKKQYRLKSEILSMNESGLLCKSIVNQNNNKSIKYEYNKYNDIVKTIDLNKNEIITFRHKYDSIGNWTQKIIFINDKPLEIQERFITYF